jgi:phage shock protein PspC (stress-responsive transcriptional regulator)
MMQKRQNNGIPGVVAGIGLLLVLLTWYRMHDR